jgi:TfoX/Sxy family transcriptional regulator of competence genes
MPWKKSPPQLIEAFDAALPADPRVERRQMFGYPCAFVGGNMFTGLHEDNLVVRLSPEARAELLAKRGAAPFQPMGRVMREYVLVPKAMTVRKQELAAWLAEAFRFASSLPSKPDKRKAKAPAAKKGGARSRRG